jgi:hypothetical protein
MLETGRRIRKQIIMRGDNIKMDLKQKLRSWTLFGNISCFNRILGLLEVEKCSKYGIFRFIADIGVYNIKLE